MVRQADILVTAVGSPGLIEKEHIKEGAVILDIGINYVTGEKNRIVGDCNYKSCKEKAAWITPVPGGVGPMTVAMLMQNIIMSWERSLGKKKN